MEKPNDANKGGEMVIKIWEGSLSAENEDEGEEAALGALSAQPD